MGIAANIVIPPNSFDAPQHRRMGTPPIPKELDDCDYDCNADTLDCAKNRNSGETDHRQPKLPSLNSEQSSKVANLNQADRRRYDDSGQGCRGHIFQKIGRPQQDHHDRKRAHDAGQLSARPGSLGDGRA